MTSFMGRQPVQGAESPTSSRAMRCCLEFYNNLVFNLVFGSEVWGENRVYPVAWSLGSYALIPFFSHLPASPGHVLSYPFPRFPGIPKFIQCPLSLPSVHRGALGAGAERVWVGHVWLAKSQMGHGSSHPGLGWHLYQGRWAMSWWEGASCPTLT